MGEDGLHPRILKRLAHSVTVPLMFIFETSMQTRCLPSHCLTYLVVPIYKKASRFDPLNYKPVSITSVPCKILERIIVKQLNAYLNDNSISNDDQFGFRSGRSTKDQVLLTYEDITSSVDKGHITDLIFFNFSKVFDLVCHRILLLKLLDFGITGHIHHSIAAFLNYRTMKVKFDGVESFSVKVISGVPQGSLRRRSICGYFLEIPCQY